MLYNYSTMAKPSAHIFAGLPNSAPSSEPLSICPNACYTKTAYAKLINNSPTWVNKLIKQGKLEEVRINGGSFIIIPKP